MKLPLDELAEKLQRYRHRLEQADGRGPTELLRELIAEIETEFAGADREQRR